jgi:succinate-acetate transporter protein
MGVFGRKKETASEMNAFLEFYLISWHMCMILVCITTLLLNIFFFIIII